VLLTFTLTEPSAALLDTNSDAKASASLENEACISDDSAAMAASMPDAFAVLPCVENSPLIVGQNELHLVTDTTLTSDTDTFRMELANTSRNAC
jgi:hypothetical protein